MKPALNLYTVKLGICSVQSLIQVQLFATPWTAACQASLSMTSSWSLLKLMSIELVMPSNHIILCQPLLFLPSIFPSILVFSSESVLHIRRPNYWNFSFSISPSNEYSGLIFLKIDWLDLLAVQGALKSLLQHHSSKASILQHSTSFIVQLSHPYMITGKTIALARQTFVVMLEETNHPGQFVQETKRILKEMTHMPGNRFWECHHLQQFRIVQFGIALEPMLNSVNVLFWGYM